MSSGYPLAECSKPLKVMFPVRESMVFALMEAGGIGGRRSLLELHRGPTHGVRGNVDTDVGLQHFIFTALLFPIFPSKASWKPRLTPARM